MPEHAVAPASSITGGPGFDSSFEGAVVGYDWVGHVLDCWMVLGACLKGWNKAMRSSRAGIPTLYWLCGASKSRRRCKNYIGQCSAFGMVVED